MHGRIKVKTTKEQEEERKIKEREEAFHFNRLTSKLFDLRPKLGDVEANDEIFKLTSELLLLNPDFYTVWNIRREVILCQQTLDKEKFETVLNNELTFTMDCLKKNQKSYSVWHQRIWVLSKLPKSEYDKEILLCNSFLNQDERNFHCWDYRSHITSLAGTDLQTEFDFTTEKIKSNFSNFSAWHRRHKLLEKGLALPQDECPKKCDLRLIWPEEYNMILNALFTDPSDQSPWLYHNWLVRNNFKHLGKEELEKLKTLQELEPDNKWVKQAIDLCDKELSNYNQSDIVKPNDKSA